MHIDSIDSSDFVDCVDYSSSIDSADSVHSVDTAWVHPGYFEISVERKARHQDGKERIKGVKNGTSAAEIRFKSRTNLYECYKCNAIIGAITMQLYVGKIRSDFFFLTLSVIFSTNTQQLFLENSGYEVTI